VVPTLVLSRGALPSAPAPNTAAAFEKILIIEGFRGRRARVGDWSHRRVRAHCRGGVATAYGFFLAAERLEFSGVIATVAAGMLSGNCAARIRTSPSTRIAVDAFWEYVAFALNSIVFLLVGLRVHVSELALRHQMIDGHGE
jgi:hypothetical protein